MGKILGDNWIDQFALLEWRPGWNTLEIPAFVETRFKKHNVAFLSTVLGVVWFDLEDERSIKAFEDQMMYAIKALKVAREQWLKKKDAH